MTKEKLFIFVLVNGLNTPCVATTSVLARELGWMLVIGFSLFELALALSVGGWSIRLGGPCL
jgi:Fe2+ transport system protein B